MAQQNLELVERLLREFTDGDLETALAIWGEDAEWRQAFIGRGGHGTVSAIHAAPTPVCRHGASKQQGVRMRSIGKRLSVAAVAAVALGSVAVTSPAGATGDSKGGPKVSITGSSDSSYAFSPATVTVGEGGKVHWTWSSNAPHNVTFKKLGEASADGKSGSFKLKFNEAGTYKYVCTIHGFKGKVVVN
jgi:plastocyanin